LPMRGRGLPRGWPITTTSGHTRRSATGRRSRRMPRSHHPRNPQQAGPLRYVRSAQPGLLLPTSNTIRSTCGVQLRLDERPGAGHIAERGVMPNIAPKRHRRWRPCFSPHLYKNRNAIERMFGRPKDFRRIATRYDRLAVNYLAAVCLAATVCYWLWVRSFRHTLPRLYG